MSELCNPVGTYEDCQVMCLALLSYMIMHKVVMLEVTCLHTCRLLSYTKAACVGDDAHI